ncbi:bifunctional diaminohydroxyphosphoribosylaminopyrimidine deaminase/5-amino-6-(5-phosphoribosylamino)uracil reductase RibD [Candidatus Nitrotoga sp. M5]|uniref:bifunctional diaminohydroxyphosphoribosylaminopyrimidine deaminase/5-amino-6-(5-phosphoribosylamino)uracil reductase RibD n=1 Tax=Candidatus Nitrotoga sp. M5 TaxID=2890409 RepID=UPI001EF2E69F|nr:bifunctional diaminohydroxyphosphoribosylaminopyrimidine deaminase/5-amino-6-(5-phosphoribosylamino)uracil reductase RibD [Candidatus Nitrotoga sp. M5]CAH1386178.1 fused diaminohydroxyphosphoribosylaminopyrimidine deaminase/5-amino-6-(5-phosphoribosylamino)uracil reductase [Candidatus Nitrotoga sp. M5]
MLSTLDNSWMASALRLAERGLYTTSPNPRVGCVLVRDNKIVGEGWHQNAGEPHAEVHALRAAGEAARGATVYVTLEPCSHQGKTPPCADALVGAGVTRVVVAMQDPNPQVAGKGMEKLRAAGIEVECGLMEVSARELNIGFSSRMTRGIPWIRSKIAMSLDGRTALNNGMSQWITGAAARQDVQHWRGRSCAVLTGIGTVLADDPQLNVRELDLAIHEIKFVRQPLRAVLDSQLQLPLTARILCGGNVVVYTAAQDFQKIVELEKLGVRVAVLPDECGRVDLIAMLRDLAVNGCNEVLVEAGSILNGALLQAGLVDELVLYIAPQLLGDVARGMAQLGEFTMLDQRVELEWQDVRNVGKDMRIVARVRHK